MKKSLHYFWLSLALAIGIFCSSCMDRDYSLSDIDAIFGIGSDSLALPVNNSTAEIPLDSFVHINTSNFIDILDNGDYVFHLSDASEKTASATVKEVTQEAREFPQRYVSLPLMGLAKNNTRKRTSVIGDVDGTFVITEADSLALATFDYSISNVPDEIYDLTSATFDDTYLDVTFSFNSAFQGCFKQVYNMAFRLPSFFVLDKAVYNGQEINPTANQVSLLNLSTSSSHTIRFYVKGLDFTANDKLGSLVFKKGESIKASGRVGLAMTLLKQDLIKTEGLVNGAIVGSAKVSKTTISYATGKFSPSFNFANWGSVKLNNIPSVLSDDSVKVDLYDPHVNLTISSTPILPIDVKVSGNLIAYDAANQVIKSLAIDPFIIPRNAGVVSLRRRYAASSGDTSVVVVPELSTLVNKIPSVIKFADIKAIGDTSTSTSVQLGTSYTLTSKYAVDCPLAFADSARIVYRKDMTGWNSSLKDLQFKDEDTEIVVTSDVENKIPMYLQLSAYGVNNRGQAISDSRLKIVVENVIAPSLDGKTPVHTSVRVVVKPLDPTVLKDLDGIKIRFDGTTSYDGESIQNVGLNAYYQTLKMNNIAVTIYGKLIYDAN